MKEDMNRHIPQNINEFSSLALAGRYPQFRPERCFLMQYIRGEILAWIVYLLCNFKGIF